MNLCSLSAANLSAYYLSKPKIRTRASRKAMVDVRFGLGGACVLRFATLRLHVFIFVNLVAQETNYSHKDADIFVLVILNRLFIKM